MSRFWVLGRNFSKCEGPYKIEERFAPTFLFKKKNALSCDFSKNYRVREEVLIKGSEKLMFYGQSAGCAPGLEATEFPEAVTLLGRWLGQGEESGGQDERRILRTI